MSLNPSNAISGQITGMAPFPNVAGRGRDDPHGVDAILVAELAAAGIERETIQRYGEPQSSIAGRLGNWAFRRAWYYWMAETDGPGLPLDEALALHSECGKSCRVGGHCGCPAPVGPVTSYHVDNSAGLAALARFVTEGAEDGPSKALASGTDGAVPDP